MPAPAGSVARAVLEVRSREVPFILEHGQIVGRLVYEKMLARPDQLYGSGSVRIIRRRGSNCRNISAVKRDEHATAP